MVRGVTSDLQTKRVALIHKRLAAAQRNAPLNDRAYDTPKLFRFLTFFQSYTIDSGGFPENDGNLGNIGQIRPIR